MISSVQLMDMARKQMQEMHELEMALCRVAYVPKYEQSTLVMQEMDTTDLVKYCKEGYYGLAE